MQKSSQLKKLASRLLATTCLTVAGGVSAMAGTIVLTQGAQEAYPGTLTPVGTTEVDGIVSLNQGANGDFFELQGLPGGATFASLGLEVVDNSGSPVGVQLFSDLPSAQTSLGPLEFALVGTPNVPVGIVPTDGNLFIEISPSNEAASSYSVFLNTTTPEPGTVAAVGLGLAGLAAARLRRKQS
jgi:PEP-CTERM motif